MGMQVDGRATKILFNDCNCHLLVMGILQVSLQGILHSHSQINYDELGCDNHQFCAAACFKFVVLFTLVALFFLCSPLFLLSLICVSTPTSNSSTLWLMPGVED